MTSHKDRYGHGRFADMIGKELESVTTSAKGCAVQFKFRDGSEARFGVDGDCCSSSWVEHLELPGDIQGAVIVSVEDGGEITQDHPEHDEENGGDCISVYNTVFKTSRGDIVLEYRNSSNGYYGGNLYRVRQ